MPPQQCTNAAARGVQAFVLVVSQHGRVLLVRAGREEWALPGGWVNPGEPVTTAATRHLTHQADLHREVTHTCTVAQTPATAPEMFTFVCYLGVVEEHHVPTARPTADPKHTANAAWVWPQDLHRLIPAGTMLDLTTSARDAVIQRRGARVRLLRQAPLLTLAPAGGG